MLAIRLQRTGRKHEPTFRVVLTDSKNGPKSGKFLENLGWYDARRDNKLDQLNVEKIKYWMSQGAQPSLTLHNFLVTNKVVAGKKRNALPKKSPIKKDTPEGEATTAPVAEQAPTSTEEKAPTTNETPAPETAPEPTPVEEVKKEIAASA